MAVEIGSSPALRAFVLAGVTTKAKARAAYDELNELIEELRGVADTFEEGLCSWEDGDDAETRREGKEQVEEAATALDEPLTTAGRCCGMADFEPSE